MLSLRCLTSVASALKFPPASIGCNHLTVEGELVSTQLHGFLVLCSVSTRVFVTASLPCEGRFETWQQQYSPSSVQQ